MQIMPGKRRVRSFLEKNKRRVALGIDSLRREGVSRTAQKVLDVFRRSTWGSYTVWMRTPLYTSEQLQAQRDQTYEK